MNVFFITDTMHSGGSERVISVLANEFSHKGICVEIICFRGDKCFYKLDEKVIIRFIEVETSGANMLKRAIWLREYCNHNRPDVVIPFMTGVYCLTIASLLGTKNKIISSERIDPRTTPLLRKFIRSILLPFTNYLVVQTESIKSYYNESIRKKCTVIYNPVDDVFFENNDVVKKKRFINVARLAPQKNQKMLINAFAAVHKDYPEYSLSIYGEGSLEKELTHYIEENGLSECVKLEGTSNRIIDELNKSFAFCLSSNFEGMSNAMIESICVGLPIITTDVSGVQEVVVPDRGGIVVGVGDEKAFERAMRKLIECQSIAQSMGEYNKVLGRELFRTDAVVEKWVNVIKQIVCK